MAVHNHSSAPGALFGMKGNLMNRNARKFHAKPLVVAIAATLCLELATGAWARNATDGGGASGMNAAPAAQVDTQSAQSTATTDTTAAPPKRTSNKTKEAQTLAAITVTGIVGSQARELVLKRYAPQIQDSISAVNIGQLPDVTISDALSRIPGVQIGRSGGEGSTISVRGLPEVAQTLNGEEFLSPGGDDGINNGGNPDLSANTPDFIDIPPTLFAGADVIKSITASDIAGGVSGIVNLRTHRPFDFHPGWTFNGSLQGDWGDRTEKINKSGSFLASYHTDRWGALLTGSYSTENITNDQPLLALYGSGAKTTEQQVGFDFNGDGTLGNNMASGQQKPDYYYAWDPMSFGTVNTQRKRTGINGSFQYKFSDALELVADGMYTKMQQTDSQYAMLLQNPQGLLPTPTPVVENGNVVNGVTNFGNIAGQQELAYGPTTSFNTNLELRYNDGGFFSGDLRWVHGRAYKNYTFVGANLIPNQLSEILLPDGTTGFANPNGVPNLTPVSVNVTGSYPDINILQDVSNPAQWLLTSAYAAANRIDAGMNVYRADGTFHFDTGPFDSFQFGARYEKQDYVFNYSYYLTPIDPKGTCANPLGPGPADAWFRFVDPRTGLICDNYVSPVARQQVTQLQPGWLTSFNNFSPLTVTDQGSASGFPALNPAVMRNPIQYLDTVATTRSGEPQEFQDPTQSWAVNERIKSIYGQLNLSGQFGSVPWNANIGMRGVRTTLDIISYKTDQADYLGNSGSWDGVLINQGPQVHTNQYTSWLPALNVAFNVTGDQILRFAANKTQARQSLADLGRGASVFYIVNGNPPRDPSLPQNVQIVDAATSGNPDLKPYTSKNYDVSYGWYFNPHSLAYLGAFFMDVSAFPEAATISEALPDADGVVRRSVPVSTIINGGGSIIRGLEAQFRTQFVQLPGWWSGFGVDLNYTFLQSTNKGAAGASHTYNAVAFYQKDKVQVRVAYNWHSRVFDLTNSATGDVLNVFTKPGGYLDASVEYDFNKHLALVVQGTNLTDTQDVQYLQTPQTWWGSNISERVYYASMRLSF